MTNQNHFMNAGITKWDGKIGNSSYTYYGNIFLIDQFFMPQLKRFTRIWIYVPSDYDSSTNHYPVLYMHDGQTVFGECRNTDENRLFMDLTLEKLLLDEKMSGLIVIAIESSDEFRRRDLNPVKVSSTSSEPRIDDYAEFIVSTLKPFIDNHFRTLPQRENTGIAGFSAGAACSIYIGLKFQEVFSKIGAFSLTLAKSFYNTPETITAIFSKRCIMKIYMDVGKKERQGLPEEIREYFVDDFEDALRNFSNKLRDFGYERNELKYYMDENGEHSLTDASRRLPDALLWLYC